MFRFDKEVARDYDTTQFRNTLPTWQELNRRKENKEELTPEEEKQYSKLGRDLVESRRVGEAQQRMRARFKDIDEQLRYWFMDKEEGSELYKAYQDFSKLREKDMQLRDKDWTDDSILQERVAAESKFLSIYRRIANRRLKNHMKAYKLKVPEQKNKVLRDFNKIFEDIVNEGGIFAIGKKMKLGTAIGLEKAKLYNSGNYVAGLDLEDTIPQKLGDEPKPIILKEAPEDLEFDEFEEEKNVIREEEDEENGNIIRT